jgi:addiction module RelE/StbE family toxin
MAQVIWAPSALGDVESIAEYIAKDSVDQARLFARRLFESVERLREFPRLGRTIPEIGNPSCREIIHGAYRIMYKIEGDEVWITGVVHGARNWKPRREAV